MTTPDMYLTPDELRFLTGRARTNLQIIQLRKMGIAFFVNASGRPVVLKSAVEGGKRATETKPSVGWQPRLVTG